MKRSKMTASELTSLFKRYSHRKSQGLIVCIAAIAVSSVFFSLCIIINMFSSIPPVWPTVFAAIMCVGMVGAVSFSFYWERVRKSILTYDFKVFLEALTTLDENSLYRDFLYYDIIDMLFQKTRWTFCSSEIFSPLRGASGCLCDILSYDAPIGLANPFVYENRAGFVKICRDILGRCDTWAIPADTHTFQTMYDACKSEVDPLLKKHKQAQKKSLHFRITCIKLLLFCLCILTFAVQLILCKCDPVSFIFNFTAIFLLGFDLVESNDKH